MTCYDAGTTSPTLLNRLGDWRDHEAWVDFVRRLQESKNAWRIKDYAAIEDAER